MELDNISVVIPTYQREKVLIDTINRILTLIPKPDELLIIDQTEEHEPETLQALKSYENSDQIRWVHLQKPSITHAMNIGLQTALYNIILFIDDDIVPDNNLIIAHQQAHKNEGVNFVAGRVVQPWENIFTAQNTKDDFSFSSSKRQWINKFIGCNFSIKKDMAIKLGGFDENFVHVAYRFELEFAERALAAGERILFEPEALIRHLRVSRGGTRSYGEHLRTIMPSHAVGDYYYLLKSKQVKKRLFRMLHRPFRAVRTKHHLLHPWWIPITLIAELLGFVWALSLFLQEPRLLGWDKENK
jgi:GT2 family glycosyltransferase